MVNRNQLPNRPTPSDAEPSYNVPRLSSQQNALSKSVPPSMPAAPRLSREERSVSQSTSPISEISPDAEEDSSITVPDANRQFGKLAPLMDDPTIEEIWINSPNRIFIARNGVSQLTTIVMSTSEVRDLIERLLMWGGRRLDLSNPFVDARLPDGSRLHVAIPEITASHWAVNIRKHLMRGKSLNALAEMDVMSPEVAEFLSMAASQGKNILVSGSTQAGKTTLLNSLVGSLPLSSRVITIEEVFELKPNLPDCVGMQTRSSNLQGEGEIPLRRLIKEALRMRPSHLVVGEIREAESLDLLIALNSGLPGMGTIHANSGRDALAKLQTLPLLAGSNISHDFIAPMVASCIDLVVHTSIVPAQSQSAADSEHSYSAGGEMGTSPHAKLELGWKKNRSDAELIANGASSSRGLSAEKGKAQRRTSRSRIDEFDPTPGSSYFAGTKLDSHSSPESGEISETNPLNARFLKETDFLDPSLIAEREDARRARLEASYQEENSYRFRGNNESTRSNLGPSSMDRGSRRITEILHVTGRIESQRVESEVIFRWNGEAYERGLVNPESVFAAGGDR